MSRVTHTGLTRGPVTLGGGGQNALESYFASLPNVLLRYRFEDVSGPVLNTGTIGSAANGSVSGTLTRGVSSGINAGLGFEATNSTALVTVPTHAASGGMTSFTVLIVARLNSDGGSSGGMLFTRLGEYTIRQGGSKRILFERIYSTTTAVALQPTDSFAFGINYAIACRIDTDRVPYIFVNGAESAYGTRTTGVGTPQNSPANWLLFNNGALARVLGGAIFDLALVEGALSNEQILAHYEAAFLA